MKKLVIFSITLFFILSILLIIKEDSYSYIDCSYKEIVPYEVTTNNLDIYLKNINYKELILICSYDKCYQIREDNIYKTINNFKELYNKELNEEKLLEINIKGYPITKIVINNC